MPDINLKKYSDCFYCIHAKNKPLGKCTAFPGGIPLDIVSGQFNHHHPHKGDNGIRFEIDEEKIERDKMNPNETTVFEEKVER